ncbi:MAG: trigger factor [Thermoleophilia bacterium]
MPVAAELTPLENDRVQLDVSVTHDEVEHAMDKALKKLAREVRVPGFRPGKVPPQVVLQRFGRDVVLNEMLKTALGEWYDTAVEASGVRPIDDPELDLDDVPDEGADLTFRATVQTRPKATLGTYKGLEVGKGEPEVPEGLVDNELERLRQRASRLVPVERAAKAGDFVVIDFDGRAGGKRLVSASAKDHMVELGANRLMEGFDDALQGAEPGHVHHLEITYDEDDNRAELRGRTVEYQLTLKQVHERVLPELDDDFAGEISEFDTLEELRADIQKHADTQAQAQVDEMFRRRAIDAAVAEATLEVPEVMVNRRIGSILNQTAGNLPRGVTFEQYLAATGRTLEQTVAQLRPDAEMALRRELVVEAIIEAEGIEVSDADVEAQVRTDAESMGRDADELLAEVRDSGALERLREDMAMNRAVDVIIQSATPVALPDPAVEAEVVDEETAEAPKEKAQDGANMESSDAEPTES